MHAEPRSVRAHPADAGDQSLLIVTLGGWCRTTFSVNPTHF
jgi:hypothetical protein